MKIVNIQSLKDYVESKNYVLYDIFCDDDTHSYCYYVGSKKDLGRRLRIEPIDQISVTKLLYGECNQEAINANPHVVNGRKVHDELYDFLGDRELDNYDAQTELIGHYLQEIKFNHPKAESLIFDCEVPVGIVVDFEKDEGSIEQWHIFGMCDAILLSEKGATDIFEYKVSQKRDRMWYKQVMLYFNMLKIIDPVRFNDKTKVWLVNLEGATEVRPQLPDFDFKNELETLMKESLDVTVELPYESDSLLVTYQKIQAAKKVLEALEKRKDEELAALAIDEKEPGKYLAGGVQITRYKASQVKINNDLVREKLPEALTTFEVLRNRLSIKI